MDMSRSLLANSAVDTAATTDAPALSSAMILFRCALAGCSLVGCSGNNSKPLNPATFIQPLADTRIDQRRATDDDRPGQLLVGARMDQSDAPGPPAPSSIPPKDRPIDQPLAAPDVTRVSPVISDSVKTPAEAATQRAANGSGAESTPNASPAAPNTSISTGEYMTLGAVVVEVNGNPIYANKILGDITPILAAHARETGADQFQNLARDEVEKQTNVLIQAELEFAAAERNLDTKDQKLANELTTQWRDQQITQAGGSIEAARAHATADGGNFDDLVKEQYRVEMRRIYFQKKEFPKLQITATDMRDYYAKHRDDVFTQHDQAKFRIIKIDFLKSGGREPALDKINNLRMQLLKGGDFAAVAGKTNDDDALLHSNGDAGFGEWIQRGAFANEKIEDAVWALKPGEITPVIELPNQFAIAKLDEKQKGVIRGFEDPDVQASIRRSLEAAQFNDLRDKVRRELEKNQIIQPWPPHIEPAVEMAMQMYPIWTKKR